ncbi:MAG: hypothetical protein AB1668_02440 [Nanoarchaeota archaeon]
MKKKAQMELVGLVIIVILITLGMLFMATFAFKSDTQKKVFTRKGLASSSMSAIMKTTVSEDADCIFGVYGFRTPPVIGYDIVDDCAKYYGNPDLEYYDTDSVYRCISPTPQNSQERLHSCTFFREITADLLSRTLGAWNKKYEFRSELIPFEGGKPIDLLAKGGGPIIAGGGCPKWKGKDRDSSGEYYIPSEAGKVLNVLYICD